MQPRFWRWFLPILTLVLGWQLGAAYQTRLLRDQAMRLDRLLGPSAGSGAAHVRFDPEHEADISVLWNAWRLLQRFYVEPGALEPQKMIYGAAEGLVRSVGDPYTVFMTPKENKDFRQALSGKLQGIGAELAERDKMIVVVSPLKGSPAQKAGLKPKDVIVEVDGQSIQGLPLNQVVERIRGPKGTTVRLKIYRPLVPEPLTFAIVRDEIRIPSVEAKVLKTQTGSLGLIVMNQFGEGSIAEVRDALLDFKNEKEPVNQPIRGVILDLRYNGGGYLDGAIELVSLFLKKGRVVTVERRGADPEHHDVTGQVAEPDLPLVVLINDGSASASEIAAGALRDHGRATLIGTETFGKGTVQEILDLPGGPSLRVTVARWLTPNGKNLGKEKVKPDIEVHRTAKDVEEEKDPQLEAAERWLLEKKVASGASVLK